jgi:hypothetical protein
LWGEVKLSSGIGEEPKESLPDDLFVKLSTELPTNVEAPDHFKKKAQRDPRSSVYAHAEIGEWSEWPYKHNLGS